MKRIPCILVEDEPASQEILKLYISDCPSLELIEVCHNAAEAGEALKKRHIHLMFLDINMPRVSGLEFYNSLPDPPRVIFTTAYPEYAVNGFEVNAIDYLVKPFGFERFVKAITKFQELTRSITQVGSPYIVVQADKKMHKINFDDIVMLEATGDYVKVYLSDRFILVHQTLQKLYDQLPSGNFFRIHKSYIISLRKLEYVEGNMAVVNSARLPIGQTYRAEFLSFLQKRG